jgi:cathepsin L
MFRVALLCCLVGVALSFRVVFDQSLNEQWEAYKVKFNKDYSQDDEQARRIIWEENIKRISQHNLRHDLGLHSYRLGLNHYADMTNEEFRARMNGARFNASNISVVHRHVRGLPKSVDWRPKGYVTGIKDQAQCGSCWAFSATGSLEGQHFKATGKLVSLSEQNLVDCSGAEGNMGCGGGLMDQAFDYIIKNKGIDTESSYPYTAQDGTCHFKSNAIGATVSSYKDVVSGDEGDLQASIASVGPISVAIDASSYNFQLYKSGVYDEASCSSWMLDHGVLAVGYDTTSDGKDYYIVKNSWGTSWGQQGYIWMSRNKSNQCGIATKASYPIV